MRKCKIRVKILTIVIICFVTMLFSAVLDIFSEYKVNQSSIRILEKNIREDYDELIKSQTDTALTMIETLQAKYNKEDNIPIDETKMRIATVIRELRYQDDAYFWVDTSDGDNIVLYGSKTEGTNRYDFKDSKGKYVMREVIVKALEGGGFTDYYFPKRDETTPQPKRAYSVYYEPFDWIIGTGVYTDNIDDVIKMKTIEQNAIMKEHVARHVLFLSILFVIAIIINISIVNNLVSPILYASSYAESISNETYSMVMNEKYLKREDEIGTLLISLEKMYKSIKFVLKEKETANNQLNNEKEFLNIILSSIGDGIIVTDQNGNIKVTNEAALSQLSIKKEDLLEQKLSERFRFFDKDSNEIPGADFLDLNMHGKFEARSEYFLKAYDKTSYVEGSTFQIRDKSEQIEGFVYVFRNIDERLEKQKEIEYLNYHDQLTGLYNRTFFEKECRRILEEESFPLSLVIADLNALKLTNDAFGHLMGDKLINTFAEVLYEHFSEIGTIARIGGDEFAILLPYTDMESTLHTINYVKKVLLDHHIESIPISAAFGCAVHENDIYSFDETFKKADERMYEQKLMESDKVKKRILSSIIKHNFNLFPEKKEEVYKVIRIAKVYAKILHLDNVTNERLIKAALVYDIGNITVNYDYFMKESTLNTKEKEEMKTHPTAAYHILKNINNFTDVAEIVLSHHENYDGSGYPRGKKNTQIPLEARILAVITDYAAMISERKYRKMLTVEEAIGQIKSNSGLRYDPELVESFIQIVRENI